MARHRLHFLDVNAGAEAAPVAVRDHGGDLRAMLHPVEQLGDRLGVSDRGVDLRVVHDQLEDSSAVTDWWIVIGAPTPTNRARTGPGWRRCRRATLDLAFPGLAPKLPGELAHLGDRLGGHGLTERTKATDGLTGRRPPISVTPSREVLRLALGAEAELLVPVELEAGRRS